jgi:hypothetical protein
MFKIKPATEVAARKVAVIVGSPDYTYPDLVFTTEFSRDLIMTMNSVVLRTALLNSVELLEKYLKIKVIDLNKKQEEPKKEKTKIKKDPKKPVEPGEVEWK